MGTKRLFVWATCALLLATVCGYLLYSRYRDAAMESDGCANYHVKVVVSTNNKLKEVFFGRDCGAIGGFTRNVSILPVTSILPNAPANALVLDMRTTTADDLAVAWDGDHDLKIRAVTFNGFCGVANSIGDVNITYSLRQTGSIRCTSMWSWTALVDVIDYASGRLSYPARIY
jgi:hypothetical protein